MLGSSHAFKEEAHVPLHLKSHGAVGDDGDVVEDCGQRRQEKRRTTVEKILRSKTQAFVMAQRQASANYENHYHCERR